jgi:nucleotidyltransferase substrate binding protein (TIGR01987 family)
MVLILTPLENALASLHRGLVRATAAPEDEELRDACIQRFEYTYELCWKLIRRQLAAEIADTTEVDGYSRKTLFRVAARRGLIADPEPWFDYTLKRNLTSHTYNPATAREVFAVLADFARHADALRARLRACVDD